jgi:hypothetical protein
MVKGTRHTLNGGLPAAHNMLRKVRQSNKIDYQLTEDVIMERKTIVADSS